MTPPGVIVLERTGRWAACVRDAARELSVKCRRARRASQCLADARQSPDSVVLIDGDDVDDLPLADLVHNLTQWNCRAFVVILLDNASAEVECLLREAGAGQIFYEPPTPHDLGGILARRFARTGASFETTSRSTHRS